MSQRLVSVVMLFVSLFCQGFKVDRPPNPDSCRRYPLMVNTSQDIIGYHVVAPLELDVGLCSGSCPYPATEGPFHRVVIDRFRVLNPTKVPSYWEYNQCGCKSYQPISMIVVIDGKYEKMNFNTLCIETCQCS